MQVGRATASLRPRAEIVHCMAVDLMPALIADHGSFDVVIAGPIASTDEGLFALRHLRVQSPTTNVILAFDRWRSGTLRNTVRTGALDLLRLPVDDDVILNAVEEALSIGWPAHDCAPAVDAKARPDGRVIVVGSATGGCGKTFYSTNLAYYLRAHLDKRTILIDLDLQFGELSTALRLKPRHTISDLVAMDDRDEAFALRLEECAVSHESGVFVLAAPDAPAEADALDANDIARVIAAASSRFDFVVVDTPAALSEGVLSAIEKAERIFSIATLDLPSVRNLGVLLTTLNQLKVPSERIQLVLNKVEHDVGMDVSTVVRYFPQGFSSVIPYGREVNRSLNMGMPMLAFAPRSEVSRALIAGFAASIEQGDEEPVAPRGRRGRRLISRR